MDDRLDIDQIEPLLQVEIAHRCDAVVDVCLIEDREGVDEDDFAEPLFVDLLVSADEGVADSGLLLKLEGHDHLRLSVHGLT